MGLVPQPNESVLSAVSANTTCHMHAQGSITGDQLALLPVALAQEARPRAQIHSCTRAHCLRATHVVAQYDQQQGLHLKAEGASDQKHKPLTIACHGFATMLRVCAWPCTVCLRHVGVSSAAAIDW